MLYIFLNAGPEESAEIWACMSIVEVSMLDGKMAWKLPLPSPATGVVAGDDAGLTYEVFEVYF